MQPDFLDRFSRGDTVCHRLPARFKILATLVVILLAVTLPISLWPLQGCLACLIFMAHSLARIPLSYLGRRLLLVLPPLLLLGIAMPATHGFAAGAPALAALVVRALLSFFAGLWLVNVTPFDKLVVGMQRLGMPRLFAAMLSLMYRYAFVVFDELGRMRTARRARMFGTRSTWGVWKDTAQLVGMLLIRSLDRAERVHGAMAARGWQGRVRTLD